MARTLLITGMSGAGKTQVMRTLEDLGYFCVDNLPPTFIPKFIELCRKKDDNTKLALVVDIRGGKFFNAFHEVLDQLTQKGVSYELVFLDAEDSTLIRRYKETRRRHPLAGRKGLSADIQKEREILSGRGQPPLSTPPKPPPNSSARRLSKSLARKANCRP